MATDLAKKIAWFESMIETIEDNIKKAELHIERLEEQQEALVSAVDALELYDRFMALPKPSVPSPELPVDVADQVQEVIENA